MEAARPIDSLYLSPHAEDVPLACPARLAADAAAGRRALLLVAFGAAPEGEAAAVLSRMGAEVFTAALAPAAVRDPAFRSYRALAGSSRPEDAGVVDALATLLASMLRRLKPRDLYLPLAVGGHVDHRLAHEAALQVVTAGAGRDVFLYEERPEAFVRGAVRIRLAQLGAVLPPAGEGAADAAGLLRYLLGFHVAPALRGDLAGLRERLRGAQLAARQWREARRWQPRRALGLRLQPSLFAPGSSLLEPARELRDAFLPAAAARTPARFTRLAKAYARRIGAGEAAERCWLLLPPRVDTPLPD
jgi:LmbE family N-acetylglucosaminyl deacetylase